VSPVLLFAWRHREDNRGLALTAHEPLSNRTFELDDDELWIFDLLSREGAEPCTYAALVEAACRRYTLPRDRAERTLSRLWSLAFIEDDDLPPGLRSGLSLWERHGCKLSLEYYASSAAHRSSVPATVHRGERAEAEPVRSGAIVLPTPDALPATPLDELLHRRRTCRQFDGRPLDRGTLSFVLAHAFEGGNVPEYLTVHVLAMRVDGIPSGVYRYLRVPHGLELVRACGPERLEQQVVEMLIGQTYVIGSGAGLLMSGDLDALVARYAAPSALRTWLVRLGALAQRMILLGHARGVQSFLSAAILDDAAARCTAGSVGGAIVPMHQVVFGHGDAGEHDFAETV
jgi:hypothetical protein